MHINSPQLIGILSISILIILISILKHFQLQIRARSRLYPRFSDPPDRCDIFRVIGKILQLYTSYSRRLYSINDDSIQFIPVDCIFKQ